MDWVSIIAVYAIVWWLVLFMVLPFGVRQVDNPEPGHERGAPARPMLVIKAMVTSVIAAVVTGVVWLAIANDWVNFRAPPV